MKKVLYISYDGMTEPLGQSQVINYLLGLKEFGYQFDILSFEKPKLYKTSGEYIQNLLRENQIGWYPQVFHTKPPILSKWFDRKNLIRVALDLYKKNKYDLVHCRSYIASEAGIILKRRFGIKFLFDMRGFWADEKADGGSWDKNHWFWRKVYAYYKQKEKIFITEADHIVSLTEAAKYEIKSWSHYTTVPISVIPCCVDTDWFAVNTKEKKENARLVLQIAEDAFVLSYLGSLGSWYLFDQMLLFFRFLSEKQPNTFFLILTNSDHQYVYNKIDSMGLDRKKIILRTVPYKEVAPLMYASDWSISFIKPVYSKMSSSPIKIGELLSMGIPIVANAVGDLQQIIGGNHCGYCIEDVFDLNQIEEASDYVSKSNSVKVDDLREAAMRFFDLKAGIELYKEVYTQLNV